MQNPELDPLSKQVKPYELDPAQQEMYDQLPNYEFPQQPGPNFMDTPPLSPTEVQAQFEQQAKDVADKRHLVEDAFAATEVHVPVGEQLVLDGQTQRADDETKAAEAARSQPIPDASNQGRKKLLHRVSSHVKDRVEGLGIKSKISGRQREQDALMRLKAGSETELVAHAGGAHELDVTQNSRTEELENKTVGEELIRALATPERMTTEMRQKMKELWTEDPAEAQRIWQGVRTYQETGNIHRITARETGKATEKLAA